ncbi:hypothetical protein LOTGIDRAFT_231853 [Lottia gigantea]|uniref:E3 SUMO-protein ligase RanBP2 n=1 Tax=Lottia gigantea TaxID=225164 RepID=V3ZX92_LOTGI|nr:hypothetical protein LOTGIDRAFT_231853 [Lottia gigantea]ESO96148.1 hypothetical protein LOTGIDRAFT_231853 [Lottia gigantea]
MLKSKQDVDRHVRNILGRIKDEKEKTSRGYQIARLYYEIKDFESAKRYLTNFLSMRENVPQAHKLLGQINESLNQNELAIQSFRRSLELDSNQQDLVNKVGGMYSNPRLERTERLVDRSVDDHMKTIKQLVVSKRAVEAFHLIKEIEGDQLYKNSLEWYEYLVENFTVIKNSIDEDEMIIYIYHLLSVLRLAYLQLSSKYLEKCNNTILLMDELLWKAEKICDKKKEWKYLRDEIQAQLFYLAGTLLLKKAEKKLLPYKDVVPISMMCYLISCSYQCLQEHMDWYNLISKEHKLFADLFSYSNYRLCQAGHMLHIMDKSPSVKPVQHYMQQLCATPWNKTLHDQLFPWIRNGESRGSFILMSTAIYNRSLTVPKVDEVVKYDKEASHLVQHKLSEIVWILVQKYSPEEIDFDIELNFSKLQYGETDLKSNAIESLSQLDIEAFLYATVRCSAMKIAEDKSGRHPFLLPAAADTSFCSPEQTEWWKFAFCFYSNNKLTDFGKMRRTLQHGLEVIRLIGSNHGLSVDMLLYLAKCFEAKMNKDVEYTASQLTLIKDRAYHYWYNVLTLLEQIESNGGNVPVVSSKHLFPEVDTHKILDPNTMLTLKEEIKLAIGKRLQEDGVYDMALDYYRSIALPWASFYSSEVYRLMGEREAELSDQRKIYLEKSLSCLHLTLDRLQGDKHHELNQLIYPYIKDIEKLIRQSENEWEEDASNNSRYHTPQGKVDVDHYQQNTSTPSSKSSSSARRLNLTPQVAEKKHLQPSPERLDSQIRQLSHYQESILKVVLRRNEELAKSNVDLAASLKECMETIKELKFEMYHRSALFGGGMNASRSYIGVQSPYKADMLPHDMMSPASAPFMDSPKPPAHLLPSQMPKGDRMSQMYQYSNVMDPNSCQMNMPNRRMQQQYGSMPDMESNYPGNQYFSPVSHDNSTFSQLPGPGYFSPIKCASKVPQPEPVQAPVVPHQSQNLPDTSSPFQVLFCGRISYGNNSNVILKIISIGNLTQVILEPTLGVGEIESYDVRNLTMHTSLSPLMVICKHKSTGFEKILHLTFETMDRSHVFTQILSQFLPPVQHAEFPSTVQASPKNSSLPSFSGFSNPVDKPEPVQQTPNSPQVPESPKATEHNTSAEEYEPNVTFEPVIALPELVPVRTGEEGEAVIYSDRGKLFRYDLAAKSWKERDSYRFLMRRDQVLKICANHVLTKDMNLTTLSNSDKAWCWSADDFADEEVKHEKFALKFKTPEAAQNFKAEFEKCQSLLPETKTGNSPVVKETKPTPGIPVKDSSESTNSASSSSQAAVFGKPAFGGSATFGSKPPAFGSTGTSAFGSSLVKPPTFGTAAHDSNKKESPFSGFSLTPKTPPKKDTCEPAKTASPFAGFSFNNKEPTSDASKKSPLKPPVLETNKSKPTENKQPSLSQLFKPDPGSWECSGCLVSNKSNVRKCLACNTLKPGEKPEPAVMSTEGGASTKFSFGASGGFSFTSTEKKNDTNTQKSGGFVFGSSSAFTTPSQPAASGIPVFGTQKQPENTAVSKEAKQPTSVKSLLESESCEASKEFEAEYGNDKNVDKTVPLSELFKNKNDTWQCTGCLCSVKTSLKQCPACMTMKPGELPDSVPTSTAESVKFSFASGGGFSFSSKPETSAPKESGSGFTFGSQSVAAPKETGFSFGSKPASNVTSTVPEKDASGAFSFGTKPPDSSTPKSTGFSFGTKPAADSTTDNTGFAFGTPSAPGTNKPGAFSFNPVPPTTSKTPVPTDGSKGFTFTPQSTPKATSQGTSNPFTAGSTPGFTFSMTPTKPASGQTSTTKSPVNKPNTSNNDDYYVNSEEDDSHIVFEPIIPLPDKVEVKTMEEDEDVLFNYRSKLFRFVNGEWKEKGLGNIKILEHRETKKRRIVMRRDQVHKVCCNHLLTSDMVIKDMPKSDGKALVWFAHDFSDEEEKVEQLSAKFKTAEIASQFQELFEESVKKAKEGGNQDTSQHTSTLEESADDKDDDDVIYEDIEYATPEEVQLARKYQLPDHFYLYTRKPPCPGCRGCEDEASVQKQDPTKKVSKIPVSSKTSEPKSSPQPQAADKPAPSLFGFGSATAAPSAPSFGSLASNQTSVVSPFSKDLANKDLSSVTFQGGDTTFSTLAASAGDNTFNQMKSSKSFKWSGAGSKLFGGGGGGGNDSTDQAEESTDEVKNEDIHFEPVIPLPDLVEVVTGEEDWESIFTQRSKLFRFDKDTSQWKERGTGEIKIMKFQDKEQYRVLFRREQVLKVVCNHMIGPHIEMTPMNSSEKAWCWVAEDFSDEEGKIEKFAVRFKTMEISQKFKEVFDKVILALQMKDQSLEDKNENNVTEEDNDDVLFDKRATLFTLDGEQWTKFGLGNLKVLKDEDVSGNSVEFVDDEGQVGCQHIICEEYTIELERSKKYCIWLAVDFSRKQKKEMKFKALFSSPSSAEEFFNKFTDSLKLASDSRLTQLDVNDDEEDYN